MALVEGELWVLAPHFRGTYTCGKTLEWHVGKEQSFPEMVALGIAASGTGKGTHCPGNHIHLSKALISECLMMNHSSIKWF